MTKPNEQQTKNLIEALDIGALSAEEQEEILLDFGDLVFQGTMLRLVERMDAATKADFDAIMETDPSEDEIMEFLQARMPDAEQAVEETIAGMRSDILAATGA